MGFLKYKHAASRMRHHDGRIFTEFAYAEKSSDGDRGFLETGSFCMGEGGLKKNFRYRWDKQHI